MLLQTAEVQRRFYRTLSVLWMTIKSVLSNETFHSTEQMQQYHLQLFCIDILGDFTLWISLSLSPDFGLSPKLRQKIKSIFFIWTYSELRTERIT